MLSYIIVITVLTIIALPVTWAFIRSANTEEAYESSGFYDAE